MSIIETMIDIPMEHERNVCGQFDAYLKKIERTLHVTMITRDGALKIIGPEQTIRQAKSVFNNLLELSKRGNTVTEQNVDYALSLSFTEKDDQILEIDKDIICRTITGKPVKPKTMGQKQYVDLIRKKMIVFGIGPAGTGKTYLAMSMAIQAFKSGEVSRRSRRGKNWVFCRAICRARSIRTCVRFTMRCIRLWGQKVTCTILRRA